MNNSNEQNYQNHKKFSTLYHYVLSPIALILFVSTVVYLIRESFTFASILLFGLSICVLLLVAVVRSFATKLQDRIIRQEENSRHFMLTGKPLDARLTLAQITALRFSADKDFPALCAKAAESGMQSNEIKKSITQWRADHVRV
ncbi:DUF6526 family protein [Paenibacillus eucommiae]|uniref:FlaA1/EpsC-like NDP-sugar epimerase n=1 Tax=Paenibacillus eucommiae TaxID=1355755 RepID=A0ABS4IQQ8_9BACL|nr:DUF6526 family protein [Paenibacillus eucommiae]MBP1989902.1 FlaA1/EpsC-like NDP-sugar epimerase [Paenibacillus eucommiae]